MSQFVESLRRLYQSNKIGDAQLKKMFASKKINQEEYDYITARKEEK
jgi:hypothetical protein